VPRQFDKHILERVAEIGEVRIETKGNGATHTTTIWIVEAAGDVFIRSVRGQRGRWYRELTSAGEGVLILRNHRVPVRAIPVDDSASIERCSRAFREKYRGDPSTPSMVRREVLSTTLRLEPR
jgi:hypothetical protein